MVGRGPEDQRAEDEVHLQVLEVEAHMGRVRVHGPLRGLGGPGPRRDQGQAEEQRERSPHGLPPYGLARSSSQFRMRSPEAWGAPSWQWNWVPWLASNSM